MPEDDEPGRIQVVEPEQETYEVPDDGGQDTGGSQHDQSVSLTYEVPDQPDQQETYEVPEEPGVCTSVNSPGGEGGRIDRFLYWGDHGNQKSGKIKGSCPQFKFAV